MKHADIGRSLRIARASADITNVEIAKRLGLTHQRVSDIARSQHASSRTIDRLAALFGMSASEFVALGEIDGDDQ